VVWCNVLITNVRERDIYIYIYICVCVITVFPDFRSFVTV